MALDRIMLGFDGRELQLLFNALDELPGRVGRPLFTRIQAEVQGQIDANAKAEREAAEKREADLREQHRAELLEEQRKAAEVAAAPPSGNGSTQILGHDPHPTITLPQEKSPLARLSPRTSRSKS